MAIYDVSTAEKKAAPSLVAGGTLYADSPIGTILPYGGASAPSGWFLCQGQAVSRTTYSELFAVIGTAFGEGDGSTTFNLPDMRESVPKGAGLTGKTVGNHLDADGLAVGEFLDDRVQTHTHLMGVTQSALANGDTYSKAVINTADLPLITMENSGRKGATTEVKSVGVNYIIKAKMVAVPADFLAKVDEAVEQLHNVTQLLIEDTALTTTATNYTTFSGRKLSDYDYFIVQQYDSSSLRNAAVINLNQFKIKNVILSSLHGANSSSPSDYSISGINVQYVDDTTVRAYATGSAMINILKIMGVKITT